LALLAFGLAGERTEREELFAMLNQRDGEHPVENATIVSDRYASCQLGRAKKWEPADAEAAGSVTLTVHSGKT
jgi:hypothetical protein